MQIIENTENLTIKFDILLGQKDYNGMKKLFVENYTENKFICCYFMGMYHYGKKEIVKTLEYFEDCINEECVDYLVRSSLYEKYVECNVRMGNVNKMMKSSLLYEYGHSSFFPISLILYKEKKYMKAIKYLEIGLGIGKNDYEIYDLLCKILVTFDFSQESIYYARKFFDTLNYSEYYKYKRFLMMLILLYEFSDNPKKIVEIISPVIAAVLGNKDDLITSRLIIAYFKLNEIDSIMSLVVNNKVDNFLGSGVYLFCMNFVDYIDDLSIKKYHEEFITRIRDNSIISGVNNCNMKNGRKKIGFIGGDFCIHVVSFFMYSIIMKYDRTKYHVTIYMTSDTKDDFTLFFMENCDEFNNVVKMSDNELLDKIRIDNIEVLIDVAGHTANTRVNVMMYKAAPIQMTYLGYPNTTGIKEIQYRITDRYCDNEETQKHFSEKFLYLSNCFINYTLNRIENMTVSPFISNGYITFAVFNKLQKITDKMLIVWSDIIRRVPGSKILFKYKEYKIEETTKKFKNKLLKYGIENYEILGFEKEMNPMVYYNVVDISLDTVPYNGTTTTCESLYMGVPVVSCIGNTHRSRVGYSLLYNSGLDKFCGKSLNEYKNIAVSIATNAEFLMELRRNLRNVFMCGYVCNATLFVKDFFDKIDEVS